MAIDSGEYRSRIGLDDLYIAEVLTDDAGTYLADTPEYLAPAAEASAEPATNQETQYADDGPYDAMTAEGETTLKLVVTGMPVEMLAKISGNAFDAASGRMFDHGGTPPYFALMFRSQKSNGSYRYYSFLKGRFSMPSEEYATKSDTPDPKTVELTFTAVKTTHPFDVGGSEDVSVKRVVGDEDTENFDGSTWYTQVQTPESGTPGALSLSSSSPASGATGVVVTADVTLTFSNTLKEGAEAGAVLLDENNAVVASAKSLSASRKVITLNPNASMTANKTYRVVYGVEDIYGQDLNGTFTFTTAP